MERRVLFSGSNYRIIDYMRIKLTILLYGCLILRASGQAGAPAGMKMHVDSLLALIKTEKDPVKRYGLVWDIYNTGAEGQPLYFLEVGKELYRIAQQNNDKIAEASAWSVYGQAYRLTGNYIKAVECHYKAIGIAEKIDNFSVRAYAINQLGHIYKDHEEFTKALELYRTAKMYADKGMNVVAQSAPLMNLGIVELALGKPDSALFFSKASLELQHASNISRYDWLNYATMAGACSQTNRTDEAQQYYALAVQAARSSKNERNIIITLTGLVTHFQQRAQVDSFLYYARMACNVVDGTVYEYLRAKPAKMLSDYYENINADSAIRYLKMYRAANETMNSTQVSQQIQMLSFEDEQRKAEIARAQKAYAQKLWIGILVVGILVLSAFLFFLFRNNRQKQRTNQQLLAQKKEIEETLARLKETQSLLVQSEKMASLGELTAGIAHEIQNPLNFVNNFAEVSAELIDEMKESLAEGNPQLAATIADDIKANLEKINHHGKRADSIVKGMLQHSRSSSGQKELADINALCDEYLRLAYHGLRAKDKSFNAGMQTDFDASIPKINVVPQDLGRVVLNLITNAFYAVNERRQSAPPGYEPMVTVATKRENDSLLISVKDNGMGIPAAIREKIFQPFFTTKPAGKGTGLGLSMSYDIVTKGHGGELLVESAEGTYTKFTIILPSIN
jgi:two-component system NtrC family sensor kinase